MKTFSGYCKVHAEDDKQLLLNPTDMDSSHPLRRSSKSSAAGTEDYTERYTQLGEGSHEHCLPSSYQPRRSSRGTLNGYDPDMNRPFDTVLSTSSSFLRRLSTRSQHDEQTASSKYIYQRDLLKDPSDDIRICLVQEKATTKKLYAIKIFTRPLQINAFKSYTRLVTTEFCIAHTLQHPNVVRVIDLLPNEHGDLCQVMEYCDAGSLLDLLEQVNKLTHDEADCFLKQLIHAVQYIHSVGVAHRNLKPENILLTRQGTLKITDFGCAECFRLPWAAPQKNLPVIETSTSTQQQQQDLKGTIAYIAPEQFGKTAFDPAAGDMWAVGIVYFAMRSGRLPWKQATDEDSLYRTFSRDLENGRGNKYMDFVAGVGQTRSHERT
jgi:protein-serine/threonine kinase